MRSTVARKRLSFHSVSRRFKLAKLKEESAELVRLELLVLPLPHESHITLLQGLIAFGTAHRAHVSTAGDKSNLRNQSGTNLDRKKNAPSAFFELNNEVNFKHF